MIILNGSIDRNAENCKLYFKNFCINLTELESFYLNKGFNIKIETLIRGELTDYKIIDNDNNSSIYLKNNILDKDNITKLLEQYNMEGMYLYYLEKMDNYYSVEVDKDDNSILLLYIFSLYILSKAYLIMEDYGKIFMNEEIVQRINKVLYGDESFEKNYDENDSIYKFISENFNSPLNEVKIIFDKIVYDIDELENCIYIKMFNQGESAILNKITNEYLISSYPIDFKELLEFYKDGKRNRQIDDFILQRMENFQKEKMHEKIKKYGIDFELIEKVVYGYSEEYEFDDEETVHLNLLKKLTTEESLYFFANNFNWDVGDDFVIPYAILNHPCCTLSIALTLFYDSEGVSTCLIDRDFEYSFHKDVYFNIINGKYKRGKFSFNVPLTKVEIYKLKKYYNLKPEEEIFITDVPGEDINIVI